MRKEQSRPLRQVQRKWKCKPAVEERGRGEEDKHATDEATEAKPNFEKEEYVTERIVSHVVNGDVDHSRARKG